MGLNPKIILKTSCAPDIVMPLSRTFTEFDGNTFENIVYQDAKYEFVLQGNDFGTSILDVQLYINNKKVNAEHEKFSLMSEDGEYQLKICPNNPPPFQLFYGIAEITVLIVYSDETERYLFSPYLAIAIKRGDSNIMDSIKEMLDDIYQKDHALLHKEKTQGISSDQIYHHIAENKFTEEISVLKTIIISLKNLLPYFLKNPHTTTVPAQYVDRLEKLHTIQSQHLVYMTTHPEQFRISYTYGIPFEHGKILPERTLVSTQKISYNTAENQAILSFINALYMHVSNRIDEFNDVMGEKNSVISLIGGMLEDYILSSTIINQYTKYALREHLEKMELIKIQLSDIFVQYQRALPCSFHVLNRVPIPTPCFLEIYHYRSVYELIIRWFSTGDYEMPSSSTILHFSSADVIYEYYCLLALYDIISELGFVECSEMRAVHDYKCKDPRYISPQNANTFYFSDEKGCELTLYYQPIIFSEDSTTRNDITLYRTDSKYYSPDFLIKKKSASKTEYGILDAKWRPQKYLLNSRDSGGLAALSYKYFYSVLDEQTLERVSFFWLLQGKDDGNRTYFHHHGSISKRQNSKFKNSTGVVRLSPKFGSYELSQLLKIYLCS